MSPEIMSLHIGSPHNQCPCDQAKLYAVICDQQVHASAIMVDGEVTITLDTASPRLSIKMLGQHGSACEQLETSVFGFFLSFFYSEETSCF